MAGKLPRRGFIKLTSLAFLGFLASALVRPAHAVKAGKAYSMLIDLDKCIGCNRCTLACKEWNKLPRDRLELYRVYVEKKLTPTTWTVVKTREVKVGEEARRVFFKWQCMHCVEPTCVSVCPTKALTKREDGPVIYDASRCIGCGYCMTSCPFNIPRFDSEKKEIVKCHLCFNRIDRGLKPACVSSCPTGALDFNLREVIVEKAQSSGRHTYGILEAGGTSVIYVSSVPFKKLGFPEPGYEPPSRFNLNLLTQVLGVGVAGLIIMPAVYFAFKRRGSQR
jgi:formate dehydrogenase iron-sulfur subunit